VINTVEDIFFYCLTNVNRMKPGNFYEINYNGDNIALFIKIYDNTLFNLMHIQEIRTWII